MSRTRLLQAMAAAAAISCAAPAAALNIVLVDPTNSFGTSPNGAEALLAFQKAANYWNKTLTNDVTVTIEIGFNALDAGVLGSTRSYSSLVSVADVYQGLASTGTTALDAIAVANLSRLNAGGGLTIRTNDYLDVANKVGLQDATTTRTGNAVINNYLDVNQSVIKALGLTGQVAPLYKYDASITFSSQFAFDYNPTNGIDAGKYDFTAVAVHELGHALGFVSGTDTFDIIMHGSGPLAAPFEAGVFGSADIADFAIGSTLDLFRYGNSVGADGKAILQWSANRDAYFSIDGKTVFGLGDEAFQSLATFSTGAYSGDGAQASHWKDNIGFIDPDAPGCFQSSRQVGIMDPTSSPCYTENVTRNDIAAFDALGWNTSVDALTNKGYVVSSADIYAMEGVAVAVPEPETWGMLALGLGVLGFMKRRRRAD
ncbi:MAG: NF038122 family metalloprotease [Roseateles sp.]